jgi:hypothetical protein
MTMALADTSGLSPEGQAFCELCATLSRLRAEGADEATVDAHLDTMDAPWWALSEKDKDAIEDLLGQGMWP